MMPSRSELRNRNSIRRLSRVSRASSGSGTFSKAVMARLLQFFEAYGLGNAELKQYRADTLFAGAKLFGEVVATADQHALSLLLLAWYGNGVQHASGRVGTRACGSRGCLFWPQARVLRGIRLAHFRLETRLSPETISNCSREMHKSI